MVELEIANIIADATGLSLKNVSNVIGLLDDGATVPFIARYRKELTGTMDEMAVRDIQLRLDSLRTLIKRKEHILDTIEQTGNLTDSLRSEIMGCYDAVKLEDLYLPFKPKRKTRASVARENGLEPLARIIMAQNCKNPVQTASRYINDRVTSVDDALSGACDIMAEWVSEKVSNRNFVRISLSRNGLLITKGGTSDSKYAFYNNYSRSLRSIPPHNYLAIRRAEAEGVLKVSVSLDSDNDIQRLTERTIKSGASSEATVLIKRATADGYKRLLLPSITSEVMAEIKERSDKVSIDLFADGLRQVLLAAPIKATTVMAIDPGFRTGCKVVCLGPEGQLLAHDVIYPVPPHNKTAESASIVRQLIAKYGCKVIALGNGTASRETEEFILSLGLPADVKIEIVSEQGASIYSASEVARREFPDLDLTYRSAVSIGRRLLDPLAELVKIDPKSIGVGQYQHDVNQTQLKDALEFTVSRCVNEVGVNLNTASAELLGYVSGIGKALADNIVAYRNQNGPFKSRNELLKVPRLGAKAFEQSSGFLRIPDAANPLDNSAVHPESYSLVRKMAQGLGLKVEELIGNAEAISQIDPKQYLGNGVGLETIADIKSELIKPGRDPREAVDSDWNDKTLKSIEQLREGLILTGKVVNLTAFGAFVDLGIKENGLIHISEMSNRRIASPTEILKIGQIIKVKVKDVDTNRHRIALTLRDL